MINRELRAVILLKRKLRQETKCFPPHGVVSILNMELILVINHVFIFLQGSVNRLVLAHAEVKVNYLQIYANKDSEGALWPIHTFLRQYLGGSSLALP